MDYYQEVLKEITECMEANNYEKASELLKAELNMPYVPLEYETQFQSLAKECGQMLRANNKQKKYDEDDIEALLDGSVDDAFVACEVLRGSNVRQHLEVVEAYLSKDPHCLIRSLLIEILMEQGVTDEMHMVYEDMELTFIPAYIEPVATREVNMQAVKILQDYFENENPVFFQMCVEILLKELYLKLPFHLDEDELFYIIVSIITYVFKANAQNDELITFIDEKNLAMYRGYDLLLDKYCI